MLWSFAVSAGCAGVSWMWQELCRFCEGLRGFFDLGTFLVVSACACNRVRLLLAPAYDCLN